MKIKYKQFLLLVSFCLIFTACAAKQREVQNVKSPGSKSHAVTNSKEEEARTPHEIAARAFISSQLPKEMLQPLYQQAAETAMLKTLGTIQDRIGRSVTENERMRMTFFWYERFKELMTYSVLEETLLPIVMKHLNLEELEQINQFNNSKVGKKLIAFQPTFLREGQIAGELLGRRKANAEWGKKTAEQLKKEFPGLYKD